MKLVYCLLGFIILIIYFNKKIKEFLSANNNFFSSIASIFTILFVPFVIVNGIQVIKSLERPKLELQFTPNKQMSFQLYNNSSVVADNVYCHFDFQSDNIEAFGFNDAYINPGNAAVLPEAIYNYASIHPSSAIMAMLIVQCRGCEQFRYFIFKGGSPSNELWFAKATSTEFNAPDIRDPQFVEKLNTQFPKERRIYR